jgi:atypical dual specificity phosphatase
MLSFNAPTWRADLLTPARQRHGPSPSFDRGRTASEVLPRVYLTDLFTARNETQLSALGITHVISVIEQPPVFPQTHFLQTLHIPLSDGSDEDILVHLPTTTSFIHDALAESPDSRVMVSDPTTYRVLLFVRTDLNQVHCLMGISRSATVVCAYLVATARMTPDEALFAVREKRGYVCPNLGFRRQLEEYARQVQGGQGRARARPAEVGRHVAEAIRKLTGGAQKEPNTGSSSSTSTSTISDVTSAPS